MAILTRKSEFGQVGREYNGQYRKRVKPATPREKVASIERRIDQLHELLSAATDAGIIASLETQIADCIISLDRAMEATS
jgi:hypothetical protein